MENEDRLKISYDEYEIVFEIEPVLDAEFAQRAEKELRETPNIRESSIAKFRELIKADSELNFPVDDESRLLVFLRPCKFYPESSYQLLRRYYEFRLHNPKIYKDLTPKNERNIFEQNLMSVLPHRDSSGSRILLLETGGKWNTSKCKVEEIFRGCALFLEAAMKEPKCQVSGVIVIIDQIGLSLNHVMQFTPSFAKALVNWIQDCLPIRLKGIHIINQPYIFNMLFAIFKPFLREKLRNRIHFHGADRKSLLKYVSPDLLPERYGGTLNYREVPGNIWHETMMKWNDDFELINTFGYSK